MYVKVCISPTVNKYTSKVGNSEIRAFGKKRNGDPWGNLLAIEQKTESSLKDDSEYTLEYILRCLEVGFWGEEFFKEASSRSLRKKYCDTNPVSGATTNFLTTNTVVVVKMEINSKFQRKLAIF